jgi:predicted deacylase
MQKITDIGPSLVLDLHNDWNKSIPYVIIESIGSEQQQEALRHLALASGLPAILETDHIPASFSSQLNLLGIPALTLELGESLIINEKNVVAGIEAVLSIIAELNMIKDQNSGNLYVESNDPARNQILTYSSKPLCSTSGIIRFAKKPGDLIKKGERIARVYNAFGKLIETIYSVHNGIILGHNDYAVAFPGSPVMAFGVIEE